MPTDTFLLDPSEFSGPGQGIINRGETDEKILPVTDGDAVITVNEERFDVMHDETGNTKRDSYRLGQNLTVSYPMKIGDMVAYAIAVSGEMDLATTVDPDGSGSSNALVARNTINAPSASLGKKTVYAFDLFRTIEPLFDATGTAVTRTVDCDKFGLRLDHCIINPNGDAYKFNKGESVYTMQIEAILPSSTDTLYRFFNTDLALAS